MTPPLHHSEEFTNKLGSARAIVCSCGFAVTYSMLGPNSNTDGWDFFRRKHEEHLAKKPDVIQEESDRQAVLLALATLALHRPGWDWMLGEIAEKFHGREMFENFKRLNNDMIGPKTV